MAKPNKKKAAKKAGVKKYKFKGPTQAQRKEMKKLGVTVKSMSKQAGVSPNSRP